MIDTKGEYVVQAEKWLLNLGLIGKVNGKYEKQDAIAVAYLQKKYNIGANGIIDNKTYGFFWALGDINKHKNDVKSGIKTQTELDAYNASIMYQSMQARHQNPDYTQDYFTIYYNIMLKHLLVGTESYVTILSMFPGAELYDVSKFLYDLSEYKKGDEAKIVADLVALGIDVAAEFADEIIDAAKMAKRVAAKKATEAISKLKLTLKYSVDELGYQIKKVISRSGNRTQVELVDGFRCYIDELKDVDEAVRPKYNEIIEGIWKYSGKSSDEIAEFYFGKVAKKTKVSGKYSGSASEILRAELKDAGIISPPFANEAHHIVPEGMNIPELDEVRALMKKYGVDLNSALVMAYFYQMHRIYHMQEVQLYIGEAIRKNMQGM